MKIQYGDNLYYPDKILRIGCIDNRSHYMGNRYTPKRENDSRWRFVVDMAMGNSNEQIEFVFNGKDEAESFRNKIIELAGE